MLTLQQLVAMTNHFDRAIEFLEKWPIGDPKEAERLNTESRKFYNLVTDAAKHLLHAQKKATGRNARKKAGQRLAAKSTTTKSVAG